MKSTSIQMFRGLFVAAVLGILTSAVNTQAAAGAAKHPMKVKQCMDRATKGHHHAKKMETSLKGLVLKEIACFNQDFDGDGTNDCFTTTYTYDKKNNRISSLSVSLDTNAPTLPTLYAYDKKGNLIGATFQSLTDTNGDGVLDVVRRVYAATYDKWGNQLTITSDGALIATNRYDARNNVIATWAGVDSDFDGVIETYISCIYTNTYDCKGNLTNQVELCDYDGDGMFESQVQRTFTYDSRGRALTMIATPADPGAGRVLSTYTYDKKGNLITIATLNDQDGDGVLDMGEGGSNTTNTYDKKGRLSLTKFEADYDGDGMVDPDSISSIQYIY